MYLCRYTAGGTYSTTSGIYAQVTDRQPDTGRLTIPIARWQACLTEVHVPTGAGLRLVLVIRYPLTNCMYSSGASLYLVEVPAIEFVASDQTKVHTYIHTHT